jgi:hypothetical protein
MSREAPVGFRELRPDEELLTGEVLRVNESGLQLQSPGRATKWVNYGAFARFLARHPVPGDRVEVVLKDGRWVNSLRFLEPVGGDEGAGGDDAPDEAGEVPF